MARRRGRARPLAAPKTGAAAGEAVVFFDKPRAEKLPAPLQAERAVGLEDAVSFGAVGRLAGKRCLAAPRRTRQRRRRLPGNEAGGVARGAGRVPRERPTRCSPVLPTEAADAVAKRGWRFYNDVGPGGRGTANVRLGHHARGCGRVRLRSGSGSERCVGGGLSGLPCDSCERARRAAGRKHLPRTAARRSVSDRRRMSVPGLITFSSEEIVEHARPSRAVLPRVVQPVCLGSPTLLELPIIEQEKFWQAHQSDRPRGADRTVGQRGCF